MVAPETVQISCADAGNKQNRRIQINTTGLYHGFVTQLVFAAAALKASMAQTLLCAAASQTVAVRYRCRDFEASVRGQRINFQTSAGVIGRSAAEQQASAWA